MAAGNFFFVAFLYIFCQTIRPIFKGKIVFAFDIFCKIIKPTFKDKLCFEFDILFVKKVDFFLKVDISF